MNSNEIAAPA